MHAWLYTIGTTEVKLYSVQTHEAVNPPSISVVVQLIIELWSLRRNRMVFTTSSISAGTNSIYDIIIAS